MDTPIFLLCLMAGILFISNVVLLRKSHEYKLQQKELKQSVKSLTRQLVKMEYQQKQYEESAKKNYVSEINQ